MKKHIWKKFVALLLAVCLLAGALPMGASAASYTTKNNMQGSDFATGALAARLDVVFRSGISGCVSPALPAVGSALDTSAKYTVTYEKLKDKNWSGWTCMAYAYAAYSYLFGYKCGDASNSYYNKVIPEAKAKKAVSYSQFQNWGVKCGTYMRTTANSDGSYNASKGHSIIILKYDSSGIYTLEGNYSSGKIGILYYTWNQFNSYTFTGKSRCVCAMTKPTENVYSSISYPSTPAPALVGKTSKPSVSVNGQTVTVSWSYSGSASYIDVYLIQQPWGPEDIKYHQSTTGNSVTFYNVADNGTGYAAYTVARPNPDSYSSEWADGIYVTLAHTTHTWDGGKVTKPATETSTGIKTYTCTVCGATKTETIAKLSHTTHKWDNGKVTKEATLTETGVKTYTCTVCGTTKTEVIAQPNSITYTGEGGGMEPIYNGGKSIWTLTKDGTLRISAPGNGEVADAPFNNEWKKYAYLVKKVVFEENVSSLRMGGIISDLPNLNSVSFPSGLKQLGNIFTNATSLKTFTVPANAEIAYTISQGCYGLTHISVDPANKYYVSNDGVVFSKSMQKLIVCPAGKSGNYIVPDGTVELGKSAFQWSKYLTSITIPKSVTNINYTTFYSSMGDLNFQGELIVYKDSYAETYAKENSIPYRIIDDEEDPGETDFTDVPANAYYAQPVAWAVENGITSGTGKGKFSPGTACTRAQAVTFLWRAAGSPSASPSSRFSDVSSNAYYSQAVNWAVQQGITSGTSEKTFSPNAVCNRAQIVTFLYRAANSPSVSDSNAFSDVNARAYYANAVKWAVANNITSGTGNGKFSPADNCVRGQIVTFLYRYAN